MQIQIKPFIPEHAQAFKDLNLQWIQAHFKVEEKDLKQLGNPQACMQGGGMIFSAVQGAQVVGVCAIYKCSDDAYELAKMAVDPKARGLGIGHLLMQAAEDWTQAQGAKELFLLSNTALVPAVALYKKRGYQTYYQGEHKDYARANISMRKYF